MASREEKQKAVMVDWQKRVIDSGEKKAVISPEFITEKLITSRQLLEKAPPAIAQRYGSLIRTVLASNDDYRITWLSVTLKSFHLGDLKAIFLAGDWEDEATLRELTY